MTPERFAELWRISDVIRRWEEDDLASNQCCVSCLGDVHTPTELEPSPLCNLCAQRYVGAITELIELVKYLRIRRSKMDPG